MSADRISHLDALALGARAADEVVLAAVRDVHDAVVARVYGVTDLLGGGRRSVPHRAHTAIATGVFASISCGLRLGSAVLRTTSAHAARHGLGGDLDAVGYGRWLTGAVNGLIGDQLREDGDAVYFETSIRVGGRPVVTEAGALAEAFPQATPRVVVFVHGLCETEDLWWRSPVPAPPREPGAPRPRNRSYGDDLETEGWTAVYLRVNTGLPIGENGVAVAAILDRLVAAWPVPVSRLALVGHSMGGLVLRAAAAVAVAPAAPSVAPSTGDDWAGRPSSSEAPWTDLVTDVVCLGTPHLGAPLERVVERGVRLFDRWPEVAPLGRILEFRSVGILDLRHGLSRDVQSLPHARYRLVGATLARRHDGLGAGSLGDLLVPFDSAMGVEPDGAEMFPGAETLHVRGDHFDLLNHDRVRTAVRGWLADRRDAPTAAHSPHSSGSRGVV